MKRTPDPHILAARTARAERDEAKSDLQIITRERDALRAAAPATALSGFSSAELIAELARRARVEAEGQRPEHFCDDCIHFKTKPDADDRYNPCQKRHKLQFWFDPEDTGPNPDMGFHRAACEDRA